MARKSKETEQDCKVHEFTRQIHSSTRTGTSYANMDNWNEKEAKEQNKRCCHDCRWFDIGFEPCKKYVGLYHKPCKDFAWS